MNKNQKGFTLIELLVVIAIIGILSSVVLASLNTARGKGANAAIKANLSNIRAQAEIYYDNQNPNSYGSYSLAACPTSTGSSNMFQDQTILNAITAAKNAAGDTSANRCVATGSTWAISMPLKVVDGTFTTWCVDSTGASTGRTAALTSGSAC